MGSKTINKLADSLNENLFEFAGYDDEAAKRAGYSNYSYWRSTWQVFTQNKIAVFLLVLIIIILAFTII